MKKWMKKVGVSQLYVSTDTYNLEYIRLSKLLEVEDFKTFQYEIPRSVLLNIKDGGKAIIDQIICAHARVFVGSFGSTFSFRIQEDRSIMGFPYDMTYNRLCGDNETESACEQPTKWKVIYPVDLKVSDTEHHDHHTEL